MQAQEDTVLLKGLEIIGQRNSIDERGIIRLDSAELEEMKSKEIARILPLFANIHLKSYGQGNLATSSFRGTSASHTQVVWNGLRINSPMLGQTNFEDLPMEFFDEISISPGNTSSLPFSGGLGGSIEMNNRAVFKKASQIDVKQSFGSFSTIKTFGNLQWSNARWYLRMRVYNKQSENDFPFKNNTYAKPYPVERRADADYKFLALMQEIAYSLSEKNSLHAFFWYQQNDRSIPPPISIASLPDNENQHKQSFRSLLRWKHLSKKYKLSLNSGFTHDKMRYSNKISSIDALHRFYTFSENMDFRYYLNTKNRINISANYTIDKVLSENYSQDISREEWHAQISSIHEFGKIAVKMKIKQLSANWEKIHWIPDISFVWEIKEDKVFLDAGIGKNYHLPGLNDMYWYPGGNPDLKPERGDILDISLQFKKKISSHSCIDWKITSFYSHIKDWILWQPDSVYAYWKAFNVKEVVSCGLESSLDYQLSLEKHRWKCRIQYAFTDSRNIAFSAEEADNYKQLIYVPKHKLSGSLNYAYKDFNLSFLSSFIGKRFTTTDNFRYMPWYWICDLSLSKDIPLRGKKIQCSLLFDNIFNIDYQSVAWQPMPGRYIEISLQYRFAL